MSDFPMKTPTKILNTIEDTRGAINNMPLRDSNSWTVKSLWLIGLIDEIASSGKYPYNAVVKALARERLGLPPLSQAENTKEGDALSRLIYNAQNYRRSDNLVAEGYIPFTAEVLAEAGVGGQIQPRFESLFVFVINGVKQGPPQPDIYTVRGVDGKLYAMKPKKRKYALAVAGQPVKVIKKGATRHDK